ncbi:MAG: serine/threonine protein kinase, partial [Myxococcales bacterium]|nr:serine/threonine protein kinase [Myxococcales bacterium]
AMARLSHPNVVTVHEVGAHGDRVFVAMEYVRGQDLRSWLAAEARHWRDVLKMFLQAGQGLAAAHEAGIVHRDFKPDNVLVGEDGRVRVADFGLAHALDHEGAAERVAPAPGAPSSTSLYTSLTRTGGLLGTPGYMAPSNSRASASTSARISSASASRCGRRCTTSVRSPPDRSRRSRAP